jgi:hypothetical protein
MRVGGILTASIPPPILNNQGISSSAADSRFMGSARQDDARLGRVLLDQFRCPERFLKFQLQGTLSARPGYFRLGPTAICYGRSSSETRPNLHDGELHDALEDVQVEGHEIRTPFDPTEVVENLRRERYPIGTLDGYQRILKALYYRLRPLMSPSLRQRIQRFHARNWRRRKFPIWPVDTTVENLGETLLQLAVEATEDKRIPFIWFWPRGHQGCVMMTHDVETEAGRDFCYELQNIDRAFTIKASFQIVPEDRYEVTSEFLERLRDRGSEVAIQDLNHDGRLFDSRERFLRRAERIQHYAREYRTRGFRAGVLYRNPDWYAALKVSFDMSIPNVAHLDPQRGGCCTVLPYFIGDVVELPVTTIQDYSLLYLLNERTIDLWKQQVELILAKHGLASFIVHPDYILENDARHLYEQLLAWLQQESRSRDLWGALPGEVDQWWRERSQMSVVKEGSRWTIEGAGADRAVLAFATTVDGRLRYCLPDSRTPLDMN